MSRQVGPMLVRSGLLVVGLLVGCGGSATHPDGDPQPPSATGGAAGDRSGAAGGSASAGSEVAGSAATPSGGRGTGVGGGAPGGGSQGLGGSQNLGGMADAGAAPVLTLPPGCQPRTPTETANNCSLAVDCDTAPSVRTYCYRLDSGLWDCQCANQDDTYRVENVAGLQACALAAQLCSDKKPELGAEKCERTTLVSDQDRCNIDVACGKPIALGASTDARAWLMRFGSARCNQFVGAESFRCTCAFGLVASDYDLLADSGEHACGPFADFCTSGATATFDGEEQCLPTYLYSDTAGCGRTEDCGATMPLAAGVSLTHLESRFATCAPGPGGGSECSCSGRDTAFLFRLSTPPDDASCASSIPNCDPGAVVKTVGAASCEPFEDDTAGDDECQSSLHCLQGATVDDRSIVAEGTLGLICRRAGAGKPWVCSCRSDQKTAQFELGATGASASQACTQAPAGCLERVGVHIGPTGDSMPPPDPSL